MKCKSCLARYDAAEPYCPHCGKKNSVTIPGLSKSPIFEFVDEPALKNPTSSPVSRNSALPQTSSSPKPGNHGCFILMVVLIFIFILFNFFSHLDFSWEEVQTENTLSDLEHYYEIGDYETMGDFLYSKPVSDNADYQKYYVTYDLYVRAHHWTSAIPDSFTLRGEYLLQGSAVKEAQYQAGFLILHELDVSASQNYPLDNEEAVRAFTKDIRYCMTDVFLLTDDEIDEVLKALNANKSYPFFELVTTSMNRINSLVH